MKLTKFKSMKKIILTALVAASSLCASAQVWMGGSLGFKSVSPKSGDSNTTFSLAPTVGYTLDENWDLAISINYENMGDVLKGAEKDAFSVEPFARYTFAKAGIASFYVDGGFSYGVTNYEGGGDATTFKIGLRPGVKVSLSDKVDLAASLGWFGYKNVKDNYDAFGLNVDNTSLNFGMYWKF
jgi:hypothetical protein